MWKDAPRANSRKTTRKKLRTQDERQRHKNIHEPIARRRSILHPWHDQGRSRETKQAVPVESAERVRRVKKISFVSLALKSQTKRSSIRVSKAVIESTVVRLTRRTDSKKSRVKGRTKSKRTKNDGEKSQKTTTRELPSQWNTLRHMWHAPAECSPSPRPIQSHSQAPFANSFTRQRA